MRLTLLAALISAVLASHASAQISAGPVGPFAVVDDTGKLVGGVLDYDESAGIEVLVSIGTTQGSGFVEIRDHDSPSVLSSFFTSSLYFATNDCTGQAFTEELKPSVDGGFGLAVTSDLKVYAATGPGTSVTVQSQLTNGACSGLAFGSNLNPVTFAGDLAAEFTPPFHLVTVASQTAAVPIHIGWLLAGVMLGLGVKAIRNSSRSTL
jgi:hypothetical protein